VKSNIFTVLFTGHIRPGRGLEVLGDVFRDLDDVELIITGRVEDNSLLNKIERLPNVSYRGYIEHKDVLRLEASSHSMIALYDPNLQTQNKFVMGNKLFEAMMVGIPIITNVASKMVNEIGCGLMVQYNNPEEIKLAIVRLKDNPELCKKMEDNGRKAFLEMYNWNVMEQRLFEIYDRLLNKKSPN
jgi:glycosyltransferase involved in cell wall biosynthesis